MTNKDLLLQAMPLCTLAENEWDIFLHYLDKIDNTTLRQTLNKLKLNQSRLEVIANYLDCFSDIIEQPIKDKSTPIYL